MTTSEQARLDARCKGCNGARIVWRGGAYGNGPCPACCGSGSVTRTIPVADAMADAETLRRVALVTSSYRTRDRRTALGRAEAYGSLAGVVANLDLESGPKQSQKCAIEAARAAFRAVPGLRG